MLLQPAMHLSCEVGIMTLPEEEEKVIGRMSTVIPPKVESYYVRFISLHRAGVISSEDLETVNNIRYEMCPKHARCRHFLRIIKNGKEHYVMNLSVFSITYKALCSDRFLLSAGKSQTTLHS